VVSTGVSALFFVNKTHLFTAWRLLNSLIFYFFPGYFPLKLILSLQVYMGGSKVAIPTPRAETTPRKMIGDSTTVAPSPSPTPGADVAKINVELPGLTNDDHEAFIREFRNPNENALLAFANVEVIKNIINKSSTPTRTRSSPSPTSSFFFFFFQIYDFPG
jgi:hypothetical protein